MKEYVLYSRPDLMRAQIGGGSGARHWPEELLDQYKQHVVDHFVPYFYFIEGTKEALAFEQYCETLGWTLNRDTILAVDRDHLSDFEYFFFNVVDSESSVGRKADISDARSHVEAAYLLTQDMASRLSDMNITGAALHRTNDGRHRLVVNARPSGPGHLRWCVRSSREPSIFFFGMESFYLTRSELDRACDFLAVRQFLPDDDGKSFETMRDFVLISGACLAALVESGVKGILQHSEQPPITFRPVEIID